MKLSSIGYSPIPWEAASVKTSTKMELATMHTWQGVALKTQRCGTQLVNCEECHYVSYMVGME